MDLLLEVTGQRSIGSMRCGRKSEGDEKQDNDLEWPYGDVSMVITAHYSELRVGASYQQTWHQ